MELDRVIVVTPFHGRPKVSEIFLQNIKDLGLKLISVCDLGDQDNINQCMEVGEVYVSHQNITGLKWNKGLELAKQYDWDYLLILGSDDLISGKYFELFNSTDRYCGLLDALAIDLNTGKYRYWRGYKNRRHGEPIGCGRLIHRSIVEAHNYNMFPNVLKGTIDLYSHSKIRTVYSSGRFLESKMTPYRVGLKSGHEISKLPANPFIYDVDLNGFYSNKVIQMINEY